MKKVSLIALCAVMLVLFIASCAIEPNKQNFYECLAATARSMALGMAWIVTIFLAFPGKQTKAEA